MHMKDRNVHMYVYTYRYACVHTYTYMVAYLEIIGCTLKVESI